MNRIRLLLVVLLLAMAVVPIVDHPRVVAQDEEDDSWQDEASGEDLYTEEEPTYEDALPPADDDSYDDSSDETAVTDETGDAPEEDLSWLPTTPYVPLDVSPFTEALAGITPQRMLELQGMIVEADVPQLEALLEAGKLTSQELVLFYVDRIVTYDMGQLNAVTQLNPDALYLAHLADIQRKNGEVKGPLQGIPVLLKENIATEDSMATTAGAIALADAPATHDAYLVRQLRDAGAVILGKTNMTEWANWMHMSIANGYSAFGGRTLSPFGGDPSGSSTGSAVAVTSNFAPLAIGTETIGSIISPATHASVVGMHPTTGLISGENVIPLSPTLDTAGPIGKTVEDIAVAMTVFAGALDSTDNRSAAATPVAGVDFMAALDPNALQGARIGVVPFDETLSDEDTLALFDVTGAIDDLEAAGAEVVVIHPSGLPDLEWWQMIACGMRDGIDTYLRQNDIADPATLSDIIEFNNADPDRYMPLGQARLEEAQACELSTADDVALTKDAVTVAQTYLDDLFAANEVDALLTLDDTYSLEYGLAGYPAITVPRGGYDDWSPTSITFVGPSCSDATLIGFAYAFEQQGPHRLVPTLVEGGADQATPTPDA
ncbi:MAG TPA: amidase family protein [Thermomicrobiales bacterium]|nr:amidase family protein [Thermomicrobiales bacterium]